jgi:hypothetical protein
MTLCLQTTINRWNCVSSDDFPDDAPEGSELHIVDTGERYIFHNGAWEEDLRLIYPQQIGF